MCLVRMMCLPAIMLAAWMLDIMLAARIAVCQPCSSAGSRGIQRCWVAACAGSIFLEPDGHFPNHMSNPEDSKAVAATRDAVLRTGADLGIMFDTDVDRSGMVDRTGRGINQNRYIALMR